MSKIALVDDNRNFLVSVSMTLKSEGFQVDTYSDGQSALNAFSHRMPDLAVLDLKMPRMDGMELLERLRLKSALPIIILSSKDDEIDEILGLQMGADVYLKKPCSQRILLERIRVLLRRHTSTVVASGEIELELPAMARGSLVMDPLRHEVRWKNMDVALTVAEFLLLQALARQPGVVMSREQLLDVVGDDEVYVGDRTIDGHITRLRKKLRDVDDEFCAIETMRKIGYRYIGEAAAET